MSRKFLDFDPMTGLLTTTAYEDGRNIVKYEQDCQPYWDINAEYRANEDRWRKGVKEGLAHAAFVPDVVIIDMKTRFGVNFYDKNQRKRVLQLIETEYPHCKTTSKKIA
jgi:hypothetical protein